MKPIKSAIVVTRPAHQQASLCQRIRDLGQHPLSIPSLKIESIPLDSNIHTVHANQIAIFVSANAVIYSRAFWMNLPEANRPALFAVGPGTANALRQLGLSATIPTVHSSEGLLALPELQHLHNKTVTLFCGKDTRPLLSDTLAARGARVVPMVCYARKPTVLSTEQVFALTQHPISAVVTTSLEGLTQWRQLIKPATLSHLLQVPTVIVHEKYAAVANALGFSHVIASHGADDDSIIKALQHLQE